MFCRIPAMCIAVLLGAAATGCGDDRLPIPPQAEQEKATALIRELYQAEFEKAKDNEAKAVLALTLLQEGKDTSDYPAGRYSLFVEAYTLAAQAGDAATALQAVDDLSQDFAVAADEAFALKVQTLTRAGAAAESASSQHTLVDAALVLLEDALAEDNFEAAQQLLGAADAAALKLKNVPLVSSIRRRQQQVSRLEKEYARWKPFADTLQKNPKDAEASYVMGKYQAFYKGNWENGLSLLAQGKDAEVGKLAALDLQRPTDPTAQIELAEGWSRVAGAAAAEEGPQILLRAYYWYVQSLADLQGASRSRVEQQMAAINERLPAEYRVGEISTEKRILLGHGGPVHAVAFSADGRRALSGGADNILRLWDTRTGKELRRFVGHGGRIWSAAFSPDGRRAASAGLDNTIRLWDLTSGREIRRFDGHDDYVRSIAFSRDGRRLLSGGDDRMVRLWNADTGEEIQAFPGHGHYVWSVALSPDGQQALSASLDKTVRLWDVKSGKEVRRFDGHRDTVLAVAFSPDGRRALSGSTDMSLILWDLQTGKALRSFSGHSGHVHDVAFSPDGRRALSASADRTLRLWDAYTGSEIRTLEAHHGTVWSVVFSSDGRLALSAGEDRTVRVWSSTD